MQKFKAGDIITKSNVWGETVLMVLETNTRADYDLYYRVLQIKSAYGDGTPVQQYAELYSKVVDATYTLQS